MKTLIITTLAFALVLGTLAAAATEPPTDPDQKAVAQGNNAFAFDLYGRLSSEPGNLFFSPYSISTALAMTYAGARGQTAEEMAQTLHFPRAPERLHPAFAGLVTTLQGSGKDRPFQLHTANALWGQKGYPFLTAFLDTARSYGGGLREVDFHNATDPARQAINRWVEEQTREKIKDLIQPGNVTPDTRLVLTNAIYFKAAWAAQFSKKATRPGDFHVSADQKVQVPLMHGTKRFPYSEGADFQLLEMPYAGGEQSLVVLLPKAGTGLADFEKALSARQLDEWLAKKKTEEVEVTLPRFKLTQAVELKKTLSALGMPLAFSPQADFSGMDGRRDLQLDKVIHKAFVDVNEEGTEAAAATAVTAKPASAPPPTEIKKFQADHPFIFLVRDHRTGSILFLGRVLNPKA